MTDFDYEDMLKRYINLIGQVEGTIFSAHWVGVFNDEEIKELERLDREIQE
ncbi:MAG: hypothetical protein Tp1125DCM00d2C21254131_65 [Prokaryotic dsDNA virus sp.]|nr:MAG: hypothetical protein Tp1125DCM00d2C21254131_65 [Prokaryotic dsDNA virus sp.]